MASIVPSVPIAGPMTDSRSELLSFESGGGAFFSLCLRSAALTVVTLGIYRFWFLTNARCFLWARTRLGADHFEYVGTGKELFLGFLVAMGIIIPAYLLNFLLSIEAAQLTPYSDVPVFFAISLLGIFASFRARRYRLTRTVFRGLRFGMGGSSWRYVLIYFRWGLLTGITLGLAYPWMAAALERYKMRHTFYGGLTGDFVGSAWELFKTMISHWVVGIFCLFLITSVIAFQASPLYALIGIGGGLLLIGQFKGREWRWWVQGIRLGPVYASPRFGAGFLVRQGAICAFLAVPFLIAVLMVSGALLSALKAADLLPKAGEPPTLLLWTLLPIYLVAVIGLSTLYRRFLQYGVWAAVAGHVALNGTEALDEVQARDGSRGGATAEALADTLDFGF